jgi:hypothetical protein
MFDLSDESANWMGGLINVDEMLFFFDEPLLFVSTIGLEKYLFYKIADDDEHHQYLAIPTSNNIVSALKNGSLSLRGALSHREYHVFQTDENLIPSHHLLVPSADLPESYLPAQGAALGFPGGKAADTLEQALTFFSLKFFSEELRHGTTTISIFRGIIDNAHESIKRIFPPPVIASQSLNRQFDFDIFPVRLASLVVALKAPTLDTSSLKPAIRNNIDKDEISRRYDSIGSRFIEDTKLVVVEAQRRELPEKFSIEHFSTLYKLQEVVPTRSNALDRLELRSRSDGKTSTIQIDEKSGTRIKEGYKIAERKPRDITGTVI